VRKKSEVLATRSIGAYFWLACEKPGPTPRPGQFYMLASVERWGGGEGERPFLPRAFSYLRAEGDRLEFLWEDVGPGTRRLSELRPGEELWLLGPLGNGFEPAANPLLVGGGIGIVPLACWQDELGDAPVLLGFRDAHHAAAAELLRDPRIATDDGSLGHHGFVTELLAAELGDVTVYACGPPPMLETVRAICAERDVPAQLALEAGMACGFGACFGCVVPTRDGYVRLCVDGPVLEAAALEGVR
jgi:dihydroorotate dehydrogenase electron transfer subunit